jgi:hypothetical protein
MKTRIETSTSTHERNTAMKRFLLLSISLVILFFTACSTPTSTPPTATKPTINSFTASPASLPAGGGSTTLIWDVKDAKTLSVDGGVGAVTGTSKTVSVTSNTTFTLTATNDAGSTTQTTSVSVGAGADTTPPTVISVDPQDGATGVKSDAIIVITFSEKMDQVATQNALQSESDKLPVDQVTFNWNAEGTVLTVDPKGDLLYARGADVNTLVARTYGFTLAGTAKDSAGNALGSVSWSFATLRRIQPKIFANGSLSGLAYSNNIFFDANATVPRVGDSITSDNKDVIARSFFTFDLSSIPNVNDIEFDFAYLNVYKLSVSGNPYAFGNINLDHVNFGPNTNNSAGNLFNTPSIGNLGVFDDPTKAVDRNHASDVMSAVRDDLNNRAARGNLSQYRLAFPGTQASQNGVQDFVFFVGILNAGLPDDKSAYLEISYVIP